MPVSDSTAKPNAVDIPGLVEHYTTTLRERGYGPVATHAYKRAVEHFIAWSAPDSDCVEVGEAPFRRFLDEHLSDCACAGRQQRGRVTALSALRHLQAILRAAGSIPPELSSFPAFVISELQDYGDFANDVCGLAPATLISRRQWIGRFLTHLFPFGRLEFSRLRPKAVRDFFTAQCRGYQPGQRTSRGIFCSELSAISRLTACGSGRGAHGGDSSDGTLAAGFSAGVPQPGGTRQANVRL